MEEEIKTLQGHMAGLVKTILQLKSKVDLLEKGVEDIGNEGVMEILKKQKAIETAIEANSAAISKIDKEILDVRKVRQNTTERASEGEVMESNEGNGNTAKKCKYFNRGHCKYKVRCSYTHPKEICKRYLEQGKCNQIKCNERHPKVCKFWSTSRNGCKRGSSCNFLHVDLANSETRLGASDMELNEEFQCISCESQWTEKRCVVEHMIKDHVVYFCLNCEDWVQHTDEVLEAGWKLFDQAGNLRNDV